LGVVDADCMPAPDEVLVLVESVEVGGGGFDRAPEVTFGLGGSEICVEGGKVEANVGVDCSF